MTIIRLERQLDGSETASSDCGPSVAVMEVAYQTGGTIRPTTEQIRRRMDKPTGWTNTLDRKKAIESYDEEAHKVGYRALRYRVETGAPLALLWELQARGRPVGATIDYGVVAEQRPDLWASRTFRGGHIIWLRRGLLIDGRKMVKVFDPLADGRYSGIPNGPQMWPWWLVREALTEFHGAGQWTGGVSAPPRLLSQPEPDDDPVDPVDEPDPLEALAIVRHALVGIRDSANAAIRAADEVYPPSMYDAEPGNGAAPEG